MLATSPDDVYTTRAPGEEKSTLSQTGYCPTQCWGHKPITGSSTLITFLGLPKSKPHSRCLVVIIITMSKVCEHLLCARRLGP